jgi:hypothetical protein
VPCGALSTQPFIRARVSPIPPDMSDARLIRNDQPHAGLLQRVAKIEVKRDPNIMRSIVAIRSDGCALWRFVNAPVYPDPCTISFFRFIYYATKSRPARIIIISAARPWVHSELSTPVSQDNIYHLAQWARPLMYRCIHTQIPIRPLLASCRAVSHTPMT